MSAEIIPIASSLGRQEEIIERSIGDVFEIGGALKRIRDGELYREAGFGGFAEYLASKPWGFTDRYAEYVMNATRVRAALEETNHGSFNERQARELAPLLKKSTPTVIRQVYGEVVAEAGGVEKVTAKAIREKVAEILPGRQRSSRRPNLEAAARAVIESAIAERGFYRVPAETMTVLMQAVGRK